MGHLIGIDIRGLSHNLFIESLAVFIFSIIAAKLAEWGLRAGATRLGQWAHAELGKQIIEMAAQPLSFSILLAGAGSAIAVVPPPGRIGFASFAIVKSLAILVWLSFGMRLSVVVLRWMAGKEGRFKAIQPVTQPLFEIAAKLVLVGSALYLVLITWGVNVTGWLASAGIVGIAVGFAARDTLANLFAGVSIVVDRPYRIGDYIRLSDAERGRVSRIGLRSTRILTHDDVEITVPNSVIANSKVVNESRPAGPSRMHLPVGVAYGADLDVVRKTLVEAAQSVAEVSNDPAPRARLIKFGDSSVDFEVLCWVENPKLRGQVRDAVNSAIYRNLVRANGFPGK